MTTLVVGASGATGRLLVEKLLDRGEAVRIIIRTKSNLPSALHNHKNLNIIYGSINDLSNEELIEHVKGCRAIVSCLGHSLNLQGIYGQPRRLVTDTARRLCHAIKANNPAQAVKFVLMNTAGNSNRDIPETPSFRHQCVIYLLRALLPPHVDNEKATDFFRTVIGQSDRQVEWVIVRPDGLIDETKVSHYDEHPSPIRDAIFDAGRTSRINVAHFMSELIFSNTKWDQWKGKMPVIYNQE